MSDNNCVLIIEPFYGGSHKQLITTLQEGLMECERERIYLVTLTPKKWHWRARTSALYISDEIPRKHCFKVLLTSSVLNLAELVALRPDLASLQKIIYFHENQLVYPVRKEKDRDFQYGYNQILSCLVADKIIFNSAYNQQSFLQSINKFFKLQPDFRPKNVEKKIAPKCKVVYFPVKFPLSIESSKRNGPLHIVWPHRWEHDKNPDLLFRVLLSLFDDGYIFFISILGEKRSAQPLIFEEASVHLKPRILNWGFIPSKEEYYHVLGSAHIVLSTANHEFFGISMVEAVYCGCYPLCPDALVYPELYPSECLYRSEEHLLTLLKSFCSNPSLIEERKNNLKLDLNKYSSATLMPVYRDLLFATS